MNAKSKFSNYDSLAMIAGAATATEPSRKKPNIDLILTIALLGDTVVIFATMAFAFWLRFNSGAIPLPAHFLPVPTFLDYMNLLVVATLCLLGTFNFLHLAEWRCFLDPWRTAKAIVKGTIVWVVAFLAICMVANLGQPISRLFVLIAFICVTGTMLAWRMVFFKIMHSDFVGVDFQQRVLFVGWGKEAERLEKEMRNGNQLGYKIVGCLPSPAGQLYRQPPPTVPVLGDYQNLTTLLQQDRADVVILADLHVRMGEIIGLSNLCEMEFAEFKIIPTYFEILASGLQLEKVGGFPILGVSQLPLSRYSSRLIKRTIDIIGAIVGLIVAIPIIIVFGGLVYRESPGPILFRQKRVGRDGKTFDILKIRSMRMDAEKNGAQWAEKNDPRRLKIGAFMRKWNIDEVPQFFNVLIGEMSLVGPRPERPELISTFKHQIPHYHARHFCLPGMTGWAQVNGWRGNTSLEERIRFDIWYIEKWTVAMDIKILILTFFKNKNAY